MRLLLDTHAFLWLMSEPERVSRMALDACASPQNSLYLSTASIWEMQIKSGYRKLDIHVPLHELVQEQVASNGLSLLGVMAEHVWALGELPALHRDPFDRMLIAQAKQERMRLVTVDRAIRRYDVQTLW